jgi:hypothetical protein
MAADQLRPREERPQPAALPHPCSSRPRRGLVQTPTQLLVTNRASTEGSIPVSQAKTCPESQHRPSLQVHANSENETSHERTRTPPPLEEERLLAARSWRENNQLKETVTSLFRCATRDWSHLPTPRAAAGARQLMAVAEGRREKTEAAAVKEPCGYYRRGR